MTVTNTIDTTAVEVSVCIEPPTYPIGLGQNRDNRGELGKGNPAWMAKPENWLTVEITIPQLAEHIGGDTGQAFMPGLLNGQRRNNKNVTMAAVLVLDIDEGISIAELKEHPIVQKYCALGIESASSGLAKGDEPACDRTRLVFPLPKLVSVGEMNAATRGLLREFGYGDEQCKDVSRFFWGAIGKKPFIMEPCKSLSLEFMEELIKRGQQKVKASKKVRKTAAKATRSGQVGDTVKMPRRGALGVAEAPEFKGSYKKVIQEIRKLKLPNEFELILGVLGKLKPGERHTGRRYITHITRPVWQAAPSVFARVMAEAHMPCTDLTLEEAEEQFTDAMNWALENGVNLATRMERLHYDFEGYFGATSVGWNKRAYILTDGGFNEVEVSALRIPFVKWRGDDIKPNTFEAEFMPWVQTQKAFDPLMDEFEEITKPHKLTKAEAWRVFQEFGELVRGEPDERASRLLSKVFLASYGRLINPGMSFQVMLILVGKGGVGKSSAFQVLGLGKTSDVEFGFGGEVSGNSYMDMNQGSFALLDEVDNYRSKRDMTMLKNFISTDTDSFNVKYKKTKVTLPRGYVIVGTSNRQDVLENDGAGNRRQWVIEMSGEGEQDGLRRLAWYRENKGRLWAAAKVLWDAGERPKLTEAESAMESKVREGHLGVSDFEERGLRIGAFIFQDMTNQRKESGAEYGVTVSVIQDAMMSLPSMNTRDKREFRRGLEGAGLSETKGARRVPGYGRVRVWSLPDCGDKLQAYPTSSIKALDRI